ncbi:hypothetical protein C8R44DRAFT_765598 [Mycena epipterygia]|nr:hypothetical protein C8R44DRAFT_765598 [Mycena epipterygia]
MLATLYLLLPLPLTYAATNIIYASDPSLVFSPGWSQEYSLTTEDLYMQTNSLVATLTATLPSSASSVSYVAYPRAGGSMYGYCLDCDSDDDQEWILQTANGSDPSVTNTSVALESTIFSMDLDPSTQHTLTVYNLPNPQSNDSSEITFDHLYVLVADDDTGIHPTSIALNQTTQVPTPTSSGVALSSTQTSSSSSATASTTSSDDPPLNSIPSSTVGTANAASASASPSGTTGTTSGVSKSLIIGISVLAVVFAASVIVGLVAFVRQRRQKSRNSFLSSQASPTGSIIPIMPPPGPPQMRTASLNPFSDPQPELSLDSPVNSSLMQRRIESRTVSPTSGPTIPLPALPLDRPMAKMESRTASPASAFPRTDLWIARPVQTPERSHFSAI